MWLWQDELQQLGFRRRSERYWRCDRRYGLGSEGHLSVFSWSEQTVGTDGALRFLVELTEFHVTFPIGRQHIHFYYHEYHEKEWQRGGHTSRRQIARLGCDPRELRSRADAIAGAVIEALGAVLRSS
jgi:hypothetical protein